jgi:hypothetical protein
VDTTSFAEIEELPDFIKGGLANIEREYPSEVINPDDIPF